MIIQESPFYCPQCGLTFKYPSTQSAAIARHLAAHQEEAYRAYALIDEAIASKRTR